MKTEGVVDNEKTGKGEKEKGEKGIKKGFKSHLKGLKIQTFCILHLVEMYTPVHRFNLRCLFEPPRPFPDWCQELDLPPEQELP